MKLFKVELTMAEMQNVMHGLDLLHTRCVNNLNSIHPLDGNAPQQKEYFRDKQTELMDQIKKYNNTYRNG